MELEFPEKLAFLFEPFRYKVLHGGRGGAKSWGVARALLVKAASNPIRVLCAREVQKSIQDSVHKLLSDQIKSMGLDGFFSITESKIIGKNGSEFFFSGIKNQTVENIKSFEGVDVCWVEEANSVSRKSWMILIPTIRKPDSEIWITFNPDLDTDETYIRFVENPPPNAKVVQMSWRDNPWFPKVLEDERAHMQRTDPIAYRNIWEGEPRHTVDGAIYASEVAQMIQDQRVRPVPYDPMLQVHTVWDLGWNDKMVVILAQRHGSEMRVIDYIEDSHRTLADYVRQLEGMPYRWGSDFLPHDGASKDFKTGQSAQEILLKLGRKPVIVPKIDPEQGIKAVRLMFPRLYIDADKCSRLIDCMKRYRRSIPATTGEPGAPVHDEFSHAADAVRYLAIAAELMRESSARKPLVYPKRAIA